MQDNFRAWPNSSTIVNERKTNSKVLKLNNCIKYVFRYMYHQIINSNLESLVLFKKILSHDQFEWET